MRQKEVYSTKAKTDNGGNFFVDVKANGEVKITLSNPSPNGGYVRESATISPSEAGKLAQAVITQAQLKAAPKAYTLADKKKEQGQSAYDPWTPESEQRLKALYSSGKSVEEISVELGRSVSAIESRIRKLSL